MLQNVFSQSKQNEAMNETWGQLRSKPMLKHFGKIYFTYGEYGNVVVIKDCFDTIEGNPWYYNNLMNFINNESNKLDQGYAYKFDGSYFETENGEGIFSGNISKISLE